MPRQKLKQRPDGRYACRYKGRFFYGSTPTEALAAREEYKRLEALGELSVSLMTFADYAAAWLPAHKSGCTSRVYADYAHMVDQLSASLGSLPLSAITSDDVSACFASFAGKSGSYIRKVRMLLSAILDAAVDAELIRSNPCRKASVTFPKGKDGSHRVLEPWEAELILATPHRMQLPALIMLYAGLRRGEVLALSWEDIDLAAGVIHVHASLRFERNQGTLSDPKTEAGARDVPILSPLRPFLAGGSGLLCPSTSGALMSEVAFRRAWDSYITALETALNGCHRRWHGRTREHQALLASGASLPPWRSITIRPHDLRHTFCTSIRDAGVDMKVAMRWLGHADEKMILRIYDHITPLRLQNSVAIANHYYLSESSQNGSQNLS